MAGDGWGFWACSEYRSVLPDGKIKSVDESELDHWRIEAGGQVKLTSPRNGWASLRVVAEGRGEFAVRAEGDGTVAVDLYREFYHKMAGEEELYLPDALVPVASGATLAVPDANDPAVGQKVQSLWVDLFIPADAAVGPHAVKLVLTAGGEEQTIEVVVDALDVAYPDEDCIVLDHNCYGNSWIPGRYPNSVPTEAGDARDEAMIAITHAYHKICFEHHGLLHMVGFGHSGATKPLFAPKATGAGKTRHLTDWTTYDKHYGPLLDGSAFADCRRKARPVYAIYTPITPSWPADYLGWGQKGFDVEFTNCLKDFDAHFREKGWTETIVEYFFNHKKRYRYFAWDGDEPRYARDDVYWKKFGELLWKAVEGSPVKWKFRSDSSWMQAEHWKTLAGVVNFWVNGGFIRWFEKEVHEGPMARGDIVWTYSGGPGVPDASSDIIQNAYKTWIRDFTGNCNWLTTDCGREPWTNNDGAQTGLMYPGEKFGIFGPIASSRLKVQRNAMQDINLLEIVAQSRGKDKVKADLIPTIPIELWDSKPSGIRELPPDEWCKENLESDIEPNEMKADKIDPLWWQAVRDYARKNAQEVNRG